MGDRIDVDSTQNIISFCTGYGGIESGIRRAGVDVRTVCNVEIEAFVQANLVAKIEEGRMDNAPIYSDLKTFPAEIFRGKVHGITCGYPCQPFSSRGKAKRRRRPKALMAIHPKDTSAQLALPGFLPKMSEATPRWGYGESCPIWKKMVTERSGDCSAAEETGAPHQRIRVFILAYRNCEGSQGMLQDFGSQGRETEGRSTARCGEHSGAELAHTAGDDVEGRDLRQGEVQSRGSGTQPAELAHTASREPRQSQARNGGQDIGGGSEEELGDAARHGRGSHQSSTQTERVEREGKEGRLSELEGGCSELGDTKHDGLYGDSISGGSGEDRERSEKGKKASEQSTRASGQEDLRYLCKTQWPARPGEEQYEWEEPRVTEAQSELGGAVDGLTHRVDRLRLLGNGVVPQTAELAWKTLWRKMNEDNH